MSLSKSWLNDNCQSISYDQYKRMKWNRKMPFQKFRRALISNGRVNYNDSNLTGMHTCNMAMLMLGKPSEAQLHKAFYPHHGGKGNKSELYGKEYAEQVIAPNFEYYAKQIGDQKPEEFLSTDYKERVAIVFTQRNKNVNESWCYLNYLLVIAQSNDGSWFVVTDHSEVLYYVKNTQLLYLMEMRRNEVPKYNAYIVG